VGTNLKRNYIWGYANNKCLMPLAKRVWKRWRIKKKRINLLTLYWYKSLRLQDKIPWIPKSHIPVLRVSTIHVDLVSVTSTLLDNLYQVAAEYGLWRLNRAAASRRQLVCNITSIYSSPFTSSHSSLLFLFFFQHSHSLNPAKKSWLAGFAVNYCAVIRKPVLQPTYVTEYVT
jgi:hypothetical protein